MRFLTPFSRQPRWTRRTGLATLLPGLAALAGSARAQEPELVLQPGLQSYIQAMAVSADGSLLATAEYYNQPVKTWDLRTGKELRTIRFRQDASGLAFSGDGRVLAVATTVNSLTLIDPASGRATLESPAPLALAAGGAIVNRRAPVAISAQGLVASGAPVRAPQRFAEHIIRLHHADGREAGVLRRVNGDGGDGGQLSALAFSTDGTLLAAGLRNGSVEVWDHGRATRVWSVPDSSTGAVRDLAFSPDGAYLLATHGSAVQVWDARTGAPVSTLQHGTGTAQVQALAFSSEERELVTATADGEVRIWEWPARVLRRSFRAPGGLNEARLVPRSRLIALALGNTLSLWDLDRGERVRDLAPNGPRLYGVLPLGDQASFLITSGGQLGHWNPAVSSLASPLRGVPGTVVETELSRDGTKVLVYSRTLVDGRPGPGFLTLASTLRDTVLWSVRVTDGEAESPRLSSDGTLAALLIDREQITLFEARTGRVLETARVGQAFDIAFLTTDTETVLLAIGMTGRTVGPAPNNTLTGMMGHRISVWRRGAAAVTVLTMGELGPAATLQVSPLARYIAWSYPEGNRVQTFDIERGRAGPELPGNGFTLAFSPTRHTLAVGSISGELTVWDLETGQVVARRSTGQPVLDQLAFSPDGTLLAGTTRGGAAYLWKGPEMEPVAALFFRGMAGLVVIDGNYYAGARSATDAVAFRLGNRAYPFEQFDLRLNRPDLVLRRLGSTDTARIAAYARAHQRRRQRMGLTGETADGGYRVPGVRLDAAGVPLATPTRRLNLRVQARDSLAVLDRLHVFVNDVPMLGAAGLSLRERSAHEWEGLVPVTLSAGRNRIQVSVQNVEGVESLRETAEVIYNGPVEKPDLYVVAIGVSAYANSRYHLSYAAKDARDIAHLFASERGRYGHVYVDTLLDGRVTRENILALRERLLRSRVDDEVVLFLAGHGVLDTEMAYYFAPADFRFDRPALRGITYDEIEGLLDGIAPRRKLLLIDTCHAGELDAGEIARRPVGQGPQRVSVRVFPGTRGFELEGEDPVSRLVEELFAELRRGSGATVIAAAGGAEFALESGRWRNGVFTFAIREGVESKAADADRDGAIRLSELRAFVTERVLTLSGGLQRPVARRENLVTDYPLFTPGPRR